MEKTANRRRGRPPKKASERKRNNVTTRVRDGLKSILEDAAAESGRSLSEEIEYRLERSFADQASVDQIVETTFGGRLTFRIFQIFASAKSLIEAHTGKEMKDDWETYQAVQHSWHQIAATFAPKKPDDWPSEPPTPIIKPTGLMGPVEFDEAFLEALEAYKAPSRLGEAAAKVLLKELMKAPGKPEQETTME